MIKKASALALMLAGTVVAGAPADAQVYGHVGINIGPPPAPLVERVPPAPGPSYAWRAGHWRWNGARYVWVRGFYARHPRGYSAWVPGHWVRGPRGWLYREGHWS